MTKKTTAPSADTQAAPVAASEDRTIPLRDLTVSSRNARKTGGMTIDSLKASILAFGLIQNLTVTSGKAGKFEVVAGARRLRAMTELRREKKIPAEYPVRCCVVDADTAREISLAENVQREAMHPADEFDAFVAVIEGEGKSAQDVADRFGIEVKQVHQRLKLGRLSPRILAAYRAGEIQGEQIKALTLSDSHEAQEAAWFGTTASWERTAHEIRSRLTAQHIDPARDRRALFVGAEAYEAAGGGVVRDLFAAAEGSGYWTDADLLTRLALEKLEVAAAAIRAEGWQWVETRISLDHSAASAFERSYPNEREPTEAEAAEIDALEAEDAALCELDEMTDEQEARGATIADRLQELEDAREEWEPEVVAMGGAILSLIHDGSLAVVRGLIRPADRRAAEAAARAADGEEAGDGIDADGGAATTTAKGPAEDAPKKLSEALTLDLTAQRTAAMRAVLIDRPDLALVTVVHNLMTREFYHSVASALELGISQHLNLPRLSPTFDGSKAQQAIAARRLEWEQRIPESAAQAWDWLVEQDQETLLSLLAFCSAQHVNGVQFKESFQNGHLPAAQRLSAAMGLDMADFWEPTADNYLGRVSKGLVLEALTEGVSAEAADNLAGLKKGALAEEAERRLAGTRWLPELLRSDKAEPVEDEEDGEGDDHAEPAPMDGEAGAADADGTSNAAPLDGAADQHHAEQDADAAKPLLYLVPAAAA